MKYRTIIVVCLAVFIAVCVISIGVGIFFLSRIPQLKPKSTRVPPLSMSNFLRQSLPTGWPLNSYIPIQADAIGGGTISTIELYINGVLYQKISSPAGWDQPEYFRQLAMAAWNDRYLYSVSESHQYNGSNGCV